MTYFDDVKRWWASRTIWFGTALTMLGAAIEVVNANSEMLMPYLGKWGGLIVTVIGVANVLLRLVTSKGIGKPEPVKAGGTD